jgi:hypothetical protein
MRVVHLVEILGGLVVVVLVVVLVFEIVIIIIVVVLVVFFVDGLEFDGSDTRHFEVGAAVRAADQIALVDIEFVDFDFGITFRAGGHYMLLAGDAPLRAARDPKPHTLCVPDRDNLRIIAKA